MSLIVTSVADTNYLHYINVLINSTTTYNPDYKFFMRFINCDYNEIMSKFEQNGVRVILETCSLDKKKNLIKDEDTIDALLQGRTLAEARKRILYSKFQCYCTHIRFANILHLLENEEDDILIVDADTIVRHELSQIEHILKDNHICARYRDLTSGGIEFDNEGFIGIKNCDFNKQFWSIVVDEIDKDMFDWDRDTIAMSIAYEKMKDELKLYKLPYTFKDDKLRDESYVWSGSFSVKDTDKYKLEMDKYGE